MMKDLREYTVSEFATEINENADVISNLIKDNRNLSYTNTPYENVKRVVEMSTVIDSNKEAVTEYIYVNLFNRPSHRFFYR